ncbi:MAG TPA: mechanosensitive ion channel family protein, partial [Luteimonas sp.]|nr:mechanosensitive ion channel family protein [Luteimonas sp.]
PALSHVSVEVQGGIVTLGGKVSEDADRTQAQVLARQVHGVSDVVSAIRLDASVQTRFDRALDEVKERVISIVAAAPLLVIAAAIVLFAWWIGTLVAQRPVRWLKQHSDNPYMDGLFRRILQSVIVLGGILLALNLLGATALVGAVLGSAGVIGLALGFAFRDVAENYIAGVLLSLRRPFAPGDHLVIDKYEGKVVALTSRATLLMTLDGNHLSLPNALVFKSVVLNYSVNPKRRFDFSLLIDPAESIRESQQLAIAEIGRVDGVLSEPAPSWVAENFVASGISLKFYGWVDQRSSDIGKVRSEALRAVKSAFAKARIEAPRSIQYVFTSPAPPSGMIDVRGTTEEPTDQGDTSVNHDIDPQLAAAQQATDKKNLLDDTARPADGDVDARTP